MLKEEKKKKKDEETGAHKLEGDLELTCTVFGWNKLTNKCTLGERASNTHTRTYCLGESGMRF